MMLPHHTAFHERLRPAPIGGGFAMDGWWVWCGSAVRAEDGRYHLFAARWPRGLRFLPAYQSYSEIVRAVADRPEGPYTFAGLVLGDRGSSHWDGRMTHNPAVVRYGGKYLLFYIGTTFEGEKPDAAQLQAGPDMWPWYRQIRIGVATADAPEGPWRRPDHPLLLPRPGMWDERVVTNPSPCVAPDGRLLLYYRSFIPGTGCRLGLAVFDGLEAPCVWRSPEPLFGDHDASFEDPCVFWVDGHYEMLTKDLTGTTTGEFHAAAHLLSRDGVAWAIAPEPRAYSRRLLWDDGQVRQMANIERPQVLMQNGLPTHLFAAMGEGSGAPGKGFDDLERSWAGVIPLS